VTTLLSICPKPAQVAIARRTAVNSERQCKRNREYAYPY
jgi:hypothetical protein